MWTGYSMMLDHHGSRWAWLLFALLIVFGVIIYASNPTAGPDVEVGENECFPAHWCIPGTTGESTIDPDGNIEVGEVRCFPAHWCIPGTASGESAIELAPTSDAPPSADRITPGRQSLSSTIKPASSKT